MGHTRAQDTRRTARAKGEAHMKGSQQLPTELVWTGEHLSEVAITAIADGEEAILPRDAFGHLGLCEVCAAGVENAASLSASVSRALSAPPAAENSVEAVRTAGAPLAFPVWGAMAAVAAAALATLLNFGAIHRWMGQMWWALREGTPLLSRHAVAFL